MVQGRSEHVQPAWLQLDLLITRAWYRVPHCAYAVA